MTCTFPRRGFVTGAASLLGYAAAAAQSTAQAIFFRPDVITALRRVDARDRVRHDALAMFRRRAHDLLTTPTLTRDTEARRDVILVTSRRAIERVLTLGLVLHVDRDPHAASRLLAELRAIAVFSDWNPKHFLDVAEMATALALGLDALRDIIDTATRAELIDALQRHAFAPALRAYREQSFWTRVTHNWNVVCNGGLIVAALSAQDASSAGAILERALASVRSGMSAYAPDGGYVEGPSYWNYATRYAGLMCHALHAVHGHSFGLAESPGFARSADFLRHMTGPTGLAFNWGDGGESVAPAGGAWFAARNSRPQDSSLALTARDRTDLAYALLAGATNEAPAFPDDLPRAARFAAIDVAAMRTRWNDRDGSFLAIKGGDNAANHCDLDLGSFVLDANGHRWASELGADDYALPGYFSSARERWRWYRKNTSGQNTLMIGGRDQERIARAPITRLDSATDRHAVTIDLSAAYGRASGTVMREAALQGDGSVSFIDRFTAAESRDILWQMHSRAAITIDGRVATLTRDAKRYALRIEAPSDAAFELADPRRAPPEATNAEFSKLILRLPETTRPRERVIAIRGGAI